MAFGNGGKETKTTNNRGKTMKTLLQRTAAWLRGERGGRWAALGLLLGASVVLAADPPRTATATATVVNGAVAGIAVTDGGAGYDNTRPPAVVIIGGGGSGATAAAVVAQRVVSGINVLSAGSGYTSAPDVAIAEPPHYASTVTIDVVLRLPIMDVVPRMTIVGTVGFTNEIQYADALGGTTLWQPLTNLVMTSSPYVFVDVTVPPGAKRFYRVSGGKVSFDNPDPANLAWIPPGQFTMGSPDSERDRYDWEGPQTQVTISQGFWMSKYEVTQGNYQAVMGSNPSYFTGDLQCPVEQVTWFAAVDYCAKLTVRERAAGRLPVGYVYRLPTEAEWEYACRAGTTTRFYYGDDYTDLGQYAWYAGNSGYKPYPVGLKRPNKWGLYDMYGNVWEWCLDWFGTYPGGSATNPVGPDSGSFRVYRGGGWRSGGKHCRSAFRPNTATDDRGYALGLRPVLAPGQ
jgi:formylglycine-generating enzyme required for sulfatase activity